LKQFPSVFHCKNAFKDFTPPKTPKIIFSYNKITISTALQWNLLPQSPLNSPFGIKIGFHGLLGDKGELIRQWLSRQVVS
jgi:hypothetical protein